ncbi:MAG: class I SAM-dependent methyltransferase [Myxococcota bacterium]
MTFPEPFPSERELFEVYDRGYMDLELPGHGLHLRFKPGYREAYRRERDLTLKDLGLRPADLAGRRILDVGCANGIFLDYLRGHGVTASGIDISSEMVEAARSRGLDARCASLDEVEGTWDAIALWDVIEHLPDPVHALERIAGLLAPGGELWLQTPCTGLVSGLFGARWRNYIHPQHLHLFSERGLAHWLGRHGFRILRRVRFGSGNTAGTIPMPLKRAADRFAKSRGVGDTIALRARLEG